MQKFQVATTPTWLLYGFWDSNLFGMLEVKEFLDTERTLEAPTFSLMWSQLIPLKGLIHRHPPQYVKGRAHCRRLKCDWKTGLYWFTHKNTTSPCTILEVKLWKWKDKKKRRFLFSWSYLFKVLDFILQDDPIGAIWLLPRQRNAVLCNLALFHIGDWRRSCNIAQTNNNMVNRALKLEPTLYNYWFY